MSRLSVPLTAFALLVSLGIAWSSQAGSRKSDSQVKASAKASKVDAQGRQTVTITLAINKGWHLYANPVNHNNDLLDGAETKVTFKAGQPVAVKSVEYPVGKTVAEGKEKYDVYEGVVTIAAELTRAPGDAGPLEITVAVQACDKNVCLAPGKITLRVP